MTMNRRSHFKIRRRGTGDGFRFVLRAIFFDSLRLGPVLTFSQRIYVWRISIHHSSSINFPWIKRKKLAPK